MPIPMDPQLIQLGAKAGFQRLDRYRRSRAMFIKAFAGHYYSAAQNIPRGMIGEEPLNLMFRAVASFIPQLVLNSPRNKVTTDYLEHAEFADLLSLGINAVQEKIKLKKELRAIIVDMFMAFGIMKTGLASSRQYISFDDIDIDPGQIFSSIVDLDNFTFDPTATSFDTSSFLGDLVCIPRAQLLESPDIYNEELVKRLPRANITVDGGKKIKELTMKNNLGHHMTMLKDLVNIVYLWIPDNNRLVTIPDPRAVTFPDFISNEDYMGPIEGPYDFFSFTPPVPNNPLPIIPAAMWFDMHTLANSMFKKTTDQAIRQKDIVFYKPSNADEMQDALEAEDGDTVASDDPSNFNTVSFGGQRPENEKMVASLISTFNFVAGNPGQAAGVSLEADTATGQEILQTNANISIEDARDIIYDGVSSLSSKHAWYMYTDPFLNMPLIRREQGKEDEQVFLTPDQRRGEFQELVFKLIPKSMSRLDPVVRTKRVIEFMTNVMPQVLIAAREALMQGIPFNAQKALTRTAEELDIGDWIKDMFDDPEFQEKLRIRLLFGPKNKGKGGGGGGGGTGSTEGVQQNGGFPIQRGTTTPGQDVNAGRQEAAAVSQSARVQ